MYPNVNDCCWALARLYQILFVGFDPSALLGISFLLLPCQQADISSLLVAWWRMFTHLPCIHPHLLYFYLTPSASTPFEGLLFRFQFVSWEVNRLLWTLISDHVLVSLGFLVDSSTNVVSMWAWECPMPFIPSSSVRLLLCSLIPIPPNPRGMEYHVY